MLRSTAESNMTYSAAKGYEDATAIDEILNYVLTKHNVSDINNRLGYYALIRTIHTSLNIIRPKVGLKQTGTHMKTIVPE